MDARLEALLHDEFSGDDQQIFLRNFKDFLKYNDASREFVVDFDLIMQAAGFAIKGNAVRFLTKNFIENEDYCIHTVDMLLPRAKQTPGCNGGHNKQQIMLTVRTFKEICILANTVQAKKVRTYYIAMERVFFKYKEQCMADAAEAAAAAANAAQRHAELLTRHNTLVDAHKNKYLVYFCLLESRDGGFMMVKIGSTKDIVRRASDLANEYGNAHVLFVFEAGQNEEFEKFLHKHECMRPHAFKGTLANGHTSTEVFLVSPAILKKFVNIADKNRTRFANASTQLQVNEHQRLINEHQRGVIAIMDRLNIVVDRSSDAVVLAEDAIAAGAAGVVAAAAPAAPVAPVAAAATTNATAAAAVANVIREAARIIVSQSEMVSERREMTQSRGLKIQKYSLDGLTLVQTYKGYTEAMRHHGTEFMSCQGIAEAIKRNSVYRGNRWATLDRNLPDDTVQVLPAQIIPTVSVTFGYVAMMDLDRAHVVKVFPDQLSAAKDRHFASASPICQAIKRQTQSGGHMFMMWSDVTEDIRNAYLAKTTLPPPAPRANSLGVEQLHPITGDVVASHVSIQTALNNGTQSSRKSLLRAIDEGTILRGSKWRFARVAADGET